MVINKFGLLRASCITYGQHDQHISNKYKGCHAGVYKNLNRELQEEGVFKQSIVETSIYDWKHSIEVTYLAFFDNSCLKLS